MDVKFHCDADANFPQKQQFRAFLYKDYSIELHNHDFYELNIILNGSGIHRIEDICITVKTGDVFIIPPAIAHSYFNSNQLDVYHILMTKEFVYSKQRESSSIPGFVSFIEIEPFLRQNNSKEMFLHLSGSELMQLKSDLLFIEEKGTYDKNDLAPLKNHTLWKLLYWFSFLLDKQLYQSKNKDATKYTVEIMRVLEYIHQNYDSKITIDLLSKVSFLSRSTFLRSFYNVCKCTPIEYVNRYRCQKALEMMNKTHLSKTQIAHSCGFYDLSHMERTIKQIM